MKLRPLCLANKICSECFWERNCAKFCIAQQHFELCSKVERRWIERSERYIAHWLVLPLQRTFQWFLLWVKHPPAWNNVSDVMAQSFNLNKLFFSWYRDTSFHCDVCNVCMERRLEGNHKCFENSGRGKCCVCLEVIIDHISYFSIASNAAGNLCSVAKILNDLKSPRRHSSS